MAAIDKLYLTNWNDYKDLIHWLFIYNPKMLLNIYDFNISADEWYNRQELLFNKHKESAEKNYLKYSKGKSSNIALLNFMNGKNQYYDKFEHLKSDFDYIEKQYIFYKNADEFEYLNEEILIADFRTNQDKYLLWHCPLDFIRDYLENQCGYKTRWYHKLFWKGKKKFK